MACYRMWFTRAYWTNYNVIEAASWIAKAVIIIPGLIFGIQLWQLYFVALGTSMTLIWASNTKTIANFGGIQHIVDLVSLHDHCAEHRYLTLLGTAR